MDKIIWKYNLIVLDLIFPVSHSIYYETIIKLYLPNLLNPHYHYNNDSY
jgi:hypothetical protein